MPFLPQGRSANLTMFTHLANGRKTAKSTASLCFNETRPARLRLHENGYEIILVRFAAVGRSRKTRKRTHPYTRIRRRKRTMKIRNDLTLTHTNTRWNENEMVLQEKTRRVAALDWNRADEASRELRENLTGPHFHCWTSAESSHCFQLAVLKKDENTCANATQTGRPARTHMFSLQLPGNDASRAELLARLHPSGATHRT